MSGFFALRRDGVDLDSLHPVGFKILLEAVARCRLRVAEVGFTFGPRYSGESKANLREGLRFATHLTRLAGRDAAHAPPTPGGAFAAVGATGLVVNTIAFWMLLRFGHLPICRRRGVLHPDLHHVELRGHGALRLLRIEGPVACWGATFGSACSTTP